MIFIKKSILEHLNVSRGGPAIDAMITEMAYPKANYAGFGLGRDACQSQTQIDRTEVRKRTDGPDATNEKISTAPVRQLDKRRLSRLMSCHRLQAKHSRPCHSSKGHAARTDQSLGTDPDFVRS